jgi:hypothetical protein
MTLIGKIFTMLILVMSIVFMSFAVMVFATHKNWKQEALTLKQQVQDAYATNNALRGELESARLLLAEHQAARRQALAALQSQLTQSIGELSKTQEELTKLQTAHTEVVQKLAVAQQSLEKFGQDNEALRTDIVTIQKDRDDKLARVASLSDQINQAQVKLQQLEERRDQLISQVAFQKLTLEQNGIDLNAPLPTSLERRVDGVITAVSDKNLVEISIGMDDGIAVGNTLEVFRDNKYLGKVVVTKVTANRSVARIDPNFQQAPIRKGDRVASKIS